VPDVSAEASLNPFVRYRTRLDSYRRWIDDGGSDAGFVDLVTVLDDAVAAVEQRQQHPAFLMTPVASWPRLARAAGLAEGVDLWVKDETNNVSGSHKARHLFGLALHLAVAERTGIVNDSELVIASCGNAALAAAVVAKASRRDLRVFIPTWADESVVDALADLGARIERCERRDGEIGDPCYLRFREAVANGSVAFSVQGTDVPATLDGGRTIGWELAEQLSRDMGGPGRLDRVFVQVGGGALGTCVAAGLSDGVLAGWLDCMPRVYGVQTEAVAPLSRAWDLLMSSAEPIEELGTSQGLDRYMWAWEDVGQSAATGILDDVTYDWVPLTRAMIDSAGRPIVVSEALVESALEVGRRATDIDVDATGTAGLAGLLALSGEVEPGETVAVLFTGARR